MLMAQAKQRTGVFPHFVRAAWIVDRDRPRQCEWPWCRSGT